jgi:hypothetical protein
VRNVYGNSYSIFLYFLCKEGELQMSKVAIVLITVVLVGILPMAGMAAMVEPSLTYQGKLTETEGSPVVDGTYSFRFNLYDVASGGTALSTDTRSVTTRNGLFTTTIAISNPDIIDGRALYLGVNVGSDAEMVPRQQILPVVYALGLRPGVVGASFTTNTAGAVWPGLPGVEISTLYALNPGVRITTAGSNSIGVLAQTSGEASTGLMSQTRGESSYGVQVTTGGAYSHGVFAHTANRSSYGVYASTSGDSSIGVHVTTGGASSCGVSASTTNRSSHGVVAATSGDVSHAMYASASGTSSYGVQAYSQQDYAIYADTGVPNGVSIKTPDYIEAMGSKYPSSDVAEYMPVGEDVTPGTVLIIGKDGRLTPSITAYDARVAGIVSTAPGVFLGSKEGGNDGEALIAVAGRVPCKVDASYGAIHPGDVLTTSPTPGYAMKAEPMEFNGRTFYPSGTILGKALGSLENGTGTIEVIVTLQ